jgi:hypothetical protein
VAANPIYFGMAGLSMVRDVLVAPPVKKKKWEKDIEILNHFYQTFSVGNRERGKRCGPTSAGKSKW